MRVSSIASSLSAACASAMADCDSVISTRLPAGLSGKPSPRPVARPPPSGSRGSLFSPVPAAVAPIFSSSSDSAARSNLLPHLADCHRIRCEFLAEANRHRILHVCPARLYYAVKLLPLLREGPLEPVQYRVKERNSRAWRCALPSGRHRLSTAPCLHGRWGEPACTRRACRPLPRWRCLRALRWCSYYAKCRPLPG